MSQTPSTQDQASPTPHAGTPVWPMVLSDIEALRKDIEARDIVGRERYGTPLCTGDGRNHLIDAYQEILDSIVYLRSCIESPPSGVDLGIDDMRQMYRTLVTMALGMRAAISPGGAS